MTILVTVRHRLFINWLKIGRTKTNRREHDNHSRERETERDRERQTERETERERKRRVIRRELRKCLRYEIRSLLVFAFTIAFPLTFECPKTAQCSNLKKMSVEITM